MSPKLVSNFMLISSLRSGSTIKKDLNVLLLGLILMASSCKNQIVGDQEQFRELFNGYTLLLIDNLPPGNIVDPLESNSLKNSHPLEKKLIPGRIYVFRKTSNFENEIFATKTLPDRLKNIGAAVTKAPKSPLELTYPIIGGPLFAIKFEKGQHPGEIFNRVHTSERSEENWEELIVIYR
jgi:hypothetical protein